MSTIWIINHYGGIPRVGIYGRHYQLAARFSEIGHEVVLFSARNHHHKRDENDTQDIIEETVAPGLRMVWIYTMKYHSAMSILRFLNWFIFAFNLLFFRPSSLPRPDIIYYSSLSLIGSISAELISKFYCIPYVYEERDIWPLTLIEVKSLSRFNPLVALLNCIQNRAYRKADLVISTLPGLQDHIRAKNIIEKDFLWLPNGCAEVKAAPIKERERAIIQDLQSAKFSIGYVGSFGKANRIDILLNAAKILQYKSQTEFFLFGSGASLSHHKEFVEKHNLTNVHFFDTVDRSFVLEIYRCVDVCYLGWGNYKMYDFGISANKLAEYMFYGKPVLHSYSGGYDFVKQSRGGITVDAGSAENVAKGVIDLEKLSKDRLEKLGRNSAEFGAKNFDFDMIFNNLNDKFSKNKWIE